MIYELPFFRVTKLKDHLRSLQYVKNVRENFGLFQEETQHRNKWRRIVKGAIATGQSRFTWKMAIKAMRICLYVCACVSVCIQGALLSYKLLLHA